MGNQPIISASLGSFPSRIHCNQEINLRARQKLCDVSVIETIRKLTRINLRSQQVQRASEVELILSRIDIVQEINLRAQQKLCDVFVIEQLIEII